MFCTGIGGLFQYISQRRDYTVCDEQTVYADYNIAKYSLKVNSEKLSKV